jgi:hypothetical protein
MYAKVSWANPATVAWICHQCKAPKKSRKLVSVRVVQPNNSYYIIVFILFTNQQPMAYKSYVPYDPCVF